MEPTNWALNAAQINHDIQLANEHLPTELQVPMYTQLGTTSPLEDPQTWQRPLVSQLTLLLLAKTCCQMDALREQVSPIELPACEHIFEGASSSDTMSETGSIPSNGPWAAMHGSGGHHGSRCEPCLALISISDWQNRDAAENAVAYSCCHAPELV